MDWCSVYLTPQGWPKYIYLSPLLIFPTTYNELGQKNARCESLRALLSYVEWDRFVTLAGSKSGMRVTLLYLELRWHNINWKPFTDNVLFMIQGNHMKEKSMIIKGKKSFYIDLLISIWQEIYLKQMRLTCFRIPLIICIVSYWNLSYCTIFIN